MNQDPNLKYIALNNFIHLFESDRALAFSDGVVVRLYKIHREFASKIAEEKAKGSALDNLLKLLKLVGDWLVELLGHLLYLLWRLEERHQLFLVLQQMTSRVGALKKRTILLRIK